MLLLLKPNYILHLPIIDSLPNRAKVLMEIKIHFVAFIRRVIFCYWWCIFLASFLSLKYSTFTESVTKHVFIVYFLKHTQQRCTWGSGCPKQCIRTTATCIFRPAWHRIQNGKTDENKSILSFVWVLHITVTKKCHFIHWFGWLHHCQMNLM